MSKRHSVAAEAAFIKARIKTMTAEEIRQLYDISVSPTGVVYDFAYDREFPNLVEWVDFNEGSEDDVEDQYTPGYREDEDY